jgi:hypothetical protein
MAQGDELKLTKEQEKEIKRAEKRRAELREQISAILGCLWEDTEPKGLLAAFLPYVSVIILVIILILLIVK